ncbi:hypothetical protein SAMN04488523_106126 [Sulfitobacter brevis]|uniref:Uncharacterized protein n=1 Tax=Sulfitobacter brevis TaxID=74348 RepID=A0A1I1ZDV0_9RHOB|nr:YeeE/YedE family protein [Sulfitobacter brevis]SFE29887.1 hypothetical protein SAMN04488523_106126 [Sulfitobacter brevis]
MIDLLGQQLSTALLGGLGGVVLGLAARLGRFCTLGGIEDALYGDSNLRLRMWGFAIGIAILGTFALEGAGVIALENALYLQVEFSWTAAVAGGLIFGYGMALAGMCGFGALARAGGGDLRAFIIVVMLGLSAYATLTGPLAPLREMLFPRAANFLRPDGLAHDLRALTGLPVSIIGGGLGLVLSAAMLWRVNLRRDYVSFLWAGAVGLAVVSGWAATAWIAANGFDPQRLISHTYAAPVGESVLYIMQGSVRALSFGIGSVVGVMVGAALGAFWQGHFRWEACEDPRELRRQILGAGLMGIGAVIAMGCTVGQGISAASTLAYSAPVTLAAIFAGATFGLRQLIVGFGQPAE